MGTFFLICCEDKQQQQQCCTHPFTYAFCSMHMFLQDSDGVTLRKKYASTWPFLRRLKALETAHCALGLSNNPGVTQCSGILTPRGLLRTPIQLQFKRESERGVSWHSTQYQI